MQNNEEEPKKEEEIIPPKLFIGEDLLESYRRYRVCLPKNSREAYFVKKICIELGKELLPSFINPDVTDDEEIKKNKEEQDKIDALYKEACDALEAEILGKRQIKYDHLIKDHRVYTLTSDDADNCEALKEELEDVKNDFKNQQYEQHMSKLEVVDSKIFHALTIGDNPVIKPVDPSFDNMKNKFKKNFLSDIMGGKVDGLQ